MMEELFPCVVLEKSVVGGWVNFLLVMLVFEIVVVKNQEAGEDSSNQEYHSSGCWCKYERAKFTRIRRGGALAIGAVFCSSNGDRIDYSRCD